MKTSAIFQLLIISSLIVGLSCIIPEYSANEVFRTFSQSLSIGFKCDSKTRNKPKEWHIDKITERLTKKGKDGHDGLLEKIVNDLGAMFATDKHEMKDAWKHYMVDKRFSQLGSCITETSEEKKLLEILSNWCLGKTISRPRFGQYYSKYWEISRKKEIEGFNLTQGVVRVALDFHYLQMGLVDSIIYNSFAHSFALSRTQYQWYNDKDKALQVKKIFESIESKQFITLEDYVQAEEKIRIDKHGHLIDNLNYSMGKYDENSCFMNTIKNFIQFSLDLDLSFLDEKSQAVFWRFLVEESKKRGLEDLMIGFEEMYSFLINGFQFNKSYEFYLLISQFISRVENFKKLHFSNHSEMSKYGKDSFYSRSKLVLSYVEDLAQLARTKGYFPKSFPDPRADTNQIEKIALLICDHWSPIYIYQEDVTHYSVSAELQKSQFPFLIQLSMMGIMKHGKLSCENLRLSLLEKASEEHKVDTGRINSLNEQLGKIMSEITSKSKYLSTEDIKEEYSSQIWHAISEYQLLVNHSSSKILLQNDKTSWKYVQEIATQEFSSITSSQATCLINFLEHSHRLRRNLPILHHIYYVMTKTGYTQRGLIVDLVGHKLEEIKEDMKVRKLGIISLSEKISTGDIEQVKNDLTSTRLNKGDITQKELEILSNIHQLIKGNSGEVPYQKWETMLLKPLSSLSHYAAKLYDDILFEFSHKNLLKNFSSKQKSSNIGIPFYHIDHKFLEEKSKKKIDDIVNHILLHSIEQEIYNMATLIKCGNKDLPLAARVGYMLEYWQQKKR